MSTEKDIANMTPKELAEYKDMLEKKRNVKRGLLERGKKRGYLTFKEIADALEGFEISAEEMEKTYDRFESEKIELVEDMEKELEEIEAEMAANPDDYQRLSELLARREQAEEELLLLYEQTEE